MKFSCTDCNLYNQCNTNFIKPSGDNLSKIMVILDAGDRDQDFKDNLLTGDTYKKLQYLFEKAGIDITKVYFTTAIKCKPKTLTAIKKKNINACRKYLIHEIVTKKPRIIITMGKYAHWAISGEESLIEYRGHFGSINIQAEKSLDFTYIPTFSAYTSLYEWRLDDYIIHDLKKAKNFYKDKTYRLNQLPNYTVVDSQKKLKEFYETMMDNDFKFVTSDFETTGLKFYRDKPINVGYCTSENNIFCVPLDQYEKEYMKKWTEEQKHYAISLNRFYNANYKKIWEVVKRVNSKPNTKWVFHNGKFDYNFAKYHKIPFGKLFFDTLLADSIIDENKYHSLNLAMEYRDIDFGAYDTKLWPYVGKKTKKSYKFAPPSIIFKYLAIDVYGDALLFKKQVKELKEEGLFEHFMKAKMPALRHMMNVEYIGCQADLDLIHKTDKLLAEKIIQLEKDAREFTQIEDFNLGSPQQIVNYMLEHEYPFERLGIKKNKTGYSTDKESLLKFKKYKKYQKLPSMILQYKAYAKLAGTYVSGKIDRKEDEVGGMLQHIAPDGRIKTNWNLWSPKTGRYSSNKPSLQVWPRPIPDLPNIRNFIKTRNDNYVIWSADYSQLEINIVAALSKDKNLIKKIQDGTDIHCDNAIEIGRVLGVTGKDTTYEYIMTAVGKGDEIENNPYSIDDIPKELQMKLKEVRTFAKGLGFGLNYGKGARTFAEEFNIDLEVAENMIHDYFVKYYGMKNWRDKLIKDGFEKGYITLLSGRKRRVGPAVEWLKSEYSKGVWSANKLQGEIERQLMNFPVQGGAHEVFEPAQVRLANRFKKDKIRAFQTLSIHDDITGECHIDDIAKVKQAILEEMPTVFHKGTKYQVEIKVDVEFYKRNWYGEKIKI